MHSFTTWFNFLNHEIRTPPNKSEHIRKMFPVWLMLESTYISLVAGDYFVKFETLIIVPRTLFSNACKML